MKVFYLGPPKTFSERAASSLAAGLGSPIELIPQANLQRVAQESAADPKDAAGVVAYYNFLEGLIQESLDLIYEHGLTLRGACRLPVEFSIGVNEITEPGLQPIYSHPKGLAQCSDFLGEHYRDSVLRPVASTAEAARLVKESRRGMAIASSDALLEQGLTIRRRDIGNKRSNRQNFTDFLLVSAAKETAATAQGEAFRTMVAITPRTERVGLLSEILAQFNFYNLNIAKIHSRPAIDPIEMSIEPQMFYLEVMSGADGEDLRRCADALDYRYGGHSVRVLGSFPSLG